MIYLDAAGPDTLVGCHGTVCRRLRFRCSSAASWRSPRPLPSHGRGRPTARRIRRWGGWCGRWPGRGGRVRRRRCSPLRPALSSAVPGAGFFVGHMVATICWIGGGGRTARSRGASSPRAAFAADRRWDGARRRAPWRNCSFRPGARLDGMFRVAVFIVVGLAPAGYGRGICATAQPAGSRRRRAAVVSVGHRIDNLD